MKMAGVGAPVIFVFQGSHSSQVLYFLCESCRKRVIHTDTGWRCWRTAEPSVRMNMLADMIRNQRVYPPLLPLRIERIAHLVLVDDPAPIPHAEAMLRSACEIIV